MANNILALNEDCLLHLFQYLEQPELFNVARTCQQLQNIVAIMWQKRYKNLDLIKMKIEHADFPYFLKMIGDTVESINTTDLLYNRVLDQNINQQFPALRQLDIVSEIIVDMQTDSIDLGSICFSRLVTKCPNLRELMLLDITVEPEQVVQLQQLRMLSLESCYLKRKNDLNYICQRLPLKSLDIRDIRGWVPDDEALSISQSECRNLNELKLMQSLLLSKLDDVCSLKCLKTLVVACDSCDFIDLNILKNINATHGQRLFYFGMGSLSLSDESICDSILAMQALRILNFNNISVPFLRRLATLTGLSELRLTACRDFTEECLLEFVRNCQNLKLIDVKGCKRLTDTFIWQAGRILLKAKHKQKNPLEINVTKSSLTVGIIEHPDFMHFQSVLKITDRIKIPSIFQEDMFECYKLKFVCDSIE